MDKIWKFCTEWACIHRWNNDLNIRATHISVFHTKVHFGWDCFRWQNNVAYLKVSSTNTFRLEALLSFYRLWSGNFMCVYCDLVRKSYDFLICNTYMLMFATLLLDFFSWGCFCQKFQKLQGGYMYSNIFFEVKWISVTANQQP